MKQLFAVLVTATVMGFGVQAFGQASVPIPIAPSLQGISNATVTTSYSNSIVAPLPLWGAGQNPFTIVGSCVCPSNTVLTGVQNSETNPFYAYCELTYSTGPGTSGPTNTTTDPIVLTLWAGTNTYTSAFFQNATNRAGASGIYCDKVVSQSSNTPNFSLWLTAPN